MCALVLKPTNFTLFFTLLLFIISLFVLFGASFPSSQTYGSWLSPSPCFCEQPGASGNDELTRTPPSAYLQAFRMRPELEDMTEVGDAIWSTISSTKQGGFLWVRHNETYKTGHGVSMFHALHCLSMIRDAIKGSKSGAVAHSHGSKRDIHVGKSEDEMHVGHCLSYVAQSLLCSADGTLERPKTYTDDAGNVLRDDVDGEDVKHQCRSAGYLREKIEQTEQRSLDSIPRLKEGATMWDLFDELR
ncbi:hypothetical protein DL95DRAFT_332209 [Leptodontidium sp. 2 PMI_412]|nr:hypothetical protein BKA61DRAFT_598753 [Leptodontidium sp. MPI-SDFR-AT-0119]KAH9218502.1 hypothetical protein DL95DRAFT_332209 [Leptodontidium sp. 2 PMI_412]